LDVLWSVAYAQCRENRFLAVYRPFFTVFPAAPNRESPGKSTLGPFSRCRAPLKNGENGENGSPPSRLRRR
jgi:hypothetical protein